MAKTIWSMNRSFYYKLLSLFPKFTVFLLILPVLSGVIGVLLLSLGFFPVIGGDIWGLHVFHEYDWLWHVSMQAHLNYRTIPSWCPWWQLQASEAKLPA